LVKCLNQTHIAALKIYVWIKCAGEVSSSIEEIDVPIFSGVSDLTIKILRIIDY